MKIAHRHHLLDTASEGMGGHAIAVRRYYNVDFHLRPIPAPLSDCPAADFSSCVCWCCCLRGEGLAAARFGPPLEVVITDLESHVDICTSNVARDAATGAQVSPHPNRSEHIF